MAPEDGYGMRHKEQVCFWIRLLVALDDCLNGFPDLIGRFGIDMNAVGVTRPEVEGKKHFLVGRNVIKMEMT